MYNRDAKLIEIVGDIFWSNIRLQLPDNLEVWDR